MTLEEIIDAIERDLPGWDWLMRSNNDPDRDATQSGERYFANISTPDYGLIDRIEFGQVHVKGERFFAYGNTREGVLMMAYQKALDHARGQVLMQ